VLTSLILQVEQQHPGMLGSVLRLDRDTNELRTAAAPSLPPEYSAQIDGLKIGPQVGSCGTAAYLRQRVIVEDIAHDPLWAPARALAAQFKLAACWSQPIFSRAGDVLGTFALYYGKPRTPTEDELHAIDLAAHVAGIAVERAAAD